MNSDNPLRYQGLTLDEDGYGVHGTMDGDMECWIVVSHHRFTRTWGEGDPDKLVREFEYVRGDDILAAAQMDDPDADVFR